MLSKEWKYKSRYYLDKQIYLDKYFSDVNYVFEINKNDPPWCHIEYVKKDTK